LAPKFAGTLIKSLAPGEPSIDEVGRLADPDLAADVRHRNTVRSLLQNECLLGVRKPDAFIVLRSSQPASLRRKTLTPSDPVFREQITTAEALIKAG
jgi:hypothetical protein